MAGFPPRSPKARDRGHPRGDRFRHEIGATRLPRLCHRSSPIPCNVSLIPLSQLRGSLQLDTFGPRVRGLAGPGLWVQGSDAYWASVLGDRHPMSRHRGPFDLAQGRLWGTPAGRISGRSRRWVNVLAIWRKAKNIPGDIGVTGSNPGRDSPPNFVSPPHVGGRTPEHRGAREKHLPSSEAGPVFRRELSRAGRRVDWNEPKSQLAASSRYARIQKLTSTPPRTATGLAAGQCIAPRVAWRRGSGCWREGETDATARDPRPCPQ
jgi:hypothetical protein